MSYKIQTGSTTEGKKYFLIGFAPPQYFDFYTFLLRGHNG